MPTPNIPAGPDYENSFVDAIRANATEVLSLLDEQDEGLLKKIQTYATRTGRSVDEVINAIRTNPFFRDTFAKDPSKQKFHENVAAKFIEGISGVKDFVQLGHDSKVVFGGRVELRKDVRREGASTTAKTIDFEWKFNDKHIYASHKYTKESGGAQDNQYRDLQEFIRQSNESNLPNTYFLAIADGNYYLGRDVGTGASKLERLKNLANRRNVFALTTSELAQWQITNLG